MSEITRERRSNLERRQAKPVQNFPIIDSAGNIIEQDRRSGLDRREDPRTTLQFMHANDLLARFAEMNEDD